MVLVDTHYAHAEKLVLVWDNLNIHAVSSLYKAFPPAEARRIAKKLEIHHTPIHASWLNMAEIEIGVLSRQCLAESMTSIDEMRRKVSAWQCRRNVTCSTVNWRFTTADMEINPILIKEHIKSNTLRRTKTDKLDAKAIAGYILEKEYRPHRTKFYNKFALKQLTRLRNRLVSIRSSYLVRMTNVLDCIFPEFKPLFDNKFSVTALYILAHYPSPEAISNMNTRSYEILRRKSRGRFSWTSS